LLSKLTSLRWSRNPIVVIGKGFTSQLEGVGGIPRTTHTFLELVGE